MFLENSYVEALAASVAELGDRAFKEAIKAKWNCKSGSLM